MLVLVLRGASDGAAGDRFGGLALAIVYALPAVLALLALRDRRPLLLPAGIGSLVLAVVPFSLHSFLWGPVGIIYLVTYAMWPSHQHAGSRSVAAAVIAPFLLLAAFFALILHDDPICYTRYQSGEVTVDHDPEQVMSGSQTIEAGSDVEERGCSSDTVVWWEAAVSVAFSGTALAAGLLLVQPARTRRGD